MRSGCAVLVLALAYAGPPIARAQPSEDAAEPTGEGAHHVEPPPPPETLPPEMLLEVRGAAIVPLAVQGLCPEGHECVLNAGVGLGVGVERRWPDRWGLVLAYDVWIVDSDSLYEIGIMHTVRVGARYVIDLATVVHPFVDACVAFLAFGDTLQVSAAGGAITAGGGAEIEISHEFAIVTAAELWLLSTASFETRDGLRRDEGFGANLALQITLGFQALLGAF